MGTAWGGGALFLDTIIVVMSRKLREQDSEIQVRVAGISGNYEVEKKVITNVLIKRKTAVAIAKNRK